MDEVQKQKMTEFLETLAQKLEAGEPCAPDRTNNTPIFRAACIWAALHELEQNNRLPLLGTLACEIINHGDAHEAVQLAEWREALMDD